MQPCWYIHKWGSWKWVGKAPYYGWVRKCRRCGLEQTK